MIHHYITKYLDNKTNKKMAVAWLQVNIPILNWCFCFSKKYLELN